MEVDALSIIRHEQTQRSLLFSFCLASARVFQKYILLGAKQSPCMVSVFSDTSSVCVFILGVFRKMNIFVYKDFVDVFFWCYH